MQNYNEAECMLKIVLSKKVNISNKINKIYLRNFFCKKKLLIKRLNKSKNIFSKPKHYYNFS